MPRPAAPLQSEASPERVLVCLLGSFQVLKHGRPLPTRRGGKAEALLAVLALVRREGMPRESLLDALWPDGDPALATQSLNSLMYSLRRLLGDALGGAAPVRHDDGWYRLNEAAGVTTDVAMFEAAVQAGERHERAGRRESAIDADARGVRLYRGDLWSGIDGDDEARLSAAIERERLRGLYLAALVRLADDAYTHGDYDSCLVHALQVLANDPVREDAHRLVMRCYAHRGERGQALRQYRLCADILRREFDAVPEPGTTALFDQLRSDPGSVSDWTGSGR